MALISGLIESFVRLKNQAWHTITIWEDPTGNAWNAQCDVAGALIVTTGAGGSISVEGVVDDDAAIGSTKPLVAGGVYFLDPTAAPLDDGDAGWLLLNAQRMAVTNPQGMYVADPAASPLTDGDYGTLLLNNLRMIVTELRTYDAPSDADRNIPVWSPPDLWTPSDLSDSLGADGTVTKYVVIEPNSRWSLQYIPTIVGGETITMTVAQSSEDTGDVTTQTYTDITNTFFGVAGFTAEEWVEPELPTGALTLRVQVTVSGYTAGTPSWGLFAFKRSNS